MNNNKKQNILGKINIINKKEKIISKAITIFNDLENHQNENKQKLNLLKEKIQHKQYFEDENKLNIIAQKLSTHITKSTDEIIFKNSNRLHLSTYKTTKTTNKKSNSKLKKPHSHYR